MLTAELLEFRRHKGRVVPRLVDPGAPLPLACAGQLLSLARTHIGRPRAGLEAGLRAADYEGVGPKTAQGLARLLLQRCTFEVAAGADPVALRASLFDAAAAAWRRDTAPGADPAGSAGWRDALLRTAAAPLGLSPAAAEGALFADLEENHRLTAVEAMSPAGLLERFNLAQVQGLLLRAERVTLSARWPAPQRLRQLLRYLKFFGLLFQQEPTEGPEGGLVLTVDGPLSVLDSATRYGLQLAEFLPALLLWEEPWRLIAEVRPGKGRAVARLELEPHAWLRSHYPDHGQWVPEDVRRFVAAFNEKSSPWRAAPAEALLPGPGNRSFVPDFEFSRAGGPPVYLEVLPYPSAEAARQRLAQVAQAEREDYLIACRGVPAVRDLAAEHPRLVVYRRSLLPGPVLAALDALP